MAYCLDKGIKEMRPAPVYKDFSQLLDQFEKAPAVATYMLLIEEIFLYLQEEEIRQQETAMFYMTVLLHELYAQRMPMSNNDKTGQLPSHWLRQRGESILLGEKSRPQVVAQISDVTKGLLHLPFSNSEHHVVCLNHLLITVNANPELFGRVGEMTAPLIRAAQSINQPQSARTVRTVLHGFSLLLGLAALTCVAVGLAFTLHTVMLASLGLMAACLLVFTIAHNWRIKKDSFENISGRAAVYCAGEKSDDEAPTKVRRGERSVGFFQERTDLARIQQPFQPATPLT